VAAVLFASAAGVLIFDLYEVVARIRKSRAGRAQGKGRSDGAIPLVLCWRMAAKLFTAAWLPLLGLSILVVPTDGGFFFANDVLCSPAAVLTATRPPEDPLLRRP
jgi:hypothetical protein